MTKVLVTCGINEEMEHHRGFAQFVMDSFARFMNRDWGEMCDEDKQMNDEADALGNRIFASYEIPDGMAVKDSEDKIWIILEADKSALTILFQSEY